MEIRKKDILPRVQVNEQINQPKKEPAETKEEVQASSLGAMSSYGKAQVSLNFKGNSPQSEKDKILSVIDNAINAYENNISCNDDRKKKFIYYLKSVQNDFINGNEDISKETYQNMKKTYLYDGYLQDNTEFAQRLFNEKKADGNYRFDNYFIILTILEKLTEENKDIIYSCINSKDEQGQYRFDQNDIYKLLEKLTPENKEFFLPILNSTDNNGRYRFSTTSTKYLISVIKPEDKELFYKLLNAVDKKGHYRFAGYNIFNILTNINPNNKETADVIIDAKDTDENYRFIDNCISNLITYWKPENKEIFDILFNAKNSDGKYRFTGGEIFTILFEITPENKDLFYTLFSMRANNSKYILSGDIISKILIHEKQKENKEYIHDLVQKVQTGELLPNYLGVRFYGDEDISFDDIKELEKSLDKSVLSNFSPEDIILAIQFKGLINKNNINEIPLSEKKGILRQFVLSNSGLFEISPEAKKYLPLIPASQEEYCNMLPNLVKSIGIETNQLSEAQIKKAFENLNTLSDILAGMSDEEFSNLKIEQEYSSSEFIKDTYFTVKDLTPQERQKVYDYFGFELYHNEFGTRVDNVPRRSFAIKGYPVNLNNGKKLASISDENTKRVVEELRPFVIKYSENNKILCNNPQLETVLNQLTAVLPEIRTQIGKKQHSTQDYNLLNHSLKVIQKISQNEEFKDLNSSDKNLMLLAGIFHDITKPEGRVDKTHPIESAFDTFYITQKLNLSRDEQIKLYSLLKSHEWLAYVNNKRADNTTERQQSVAFDMQYDNLFQLAKIFTIADLKAVKQGEFFFKKYANDFYAHSAKIESLIDELKKSQPLLPITQIPKASTIKSALKTVNSDGSTNFKGIYQDKNGMIIIKFNEVENDTWEKIGFPKGSISNGIQAKGISSVYGNILENDNIDTGNIKFFVHGLDNPNQLVKFDAFNLPDSDALLSVSYTERPESKYRFFRTQGVILNTNTKYMHGGGKTDAGSGKSKDLDLFKQDYVFGGRREDDRKYISNLIKEALNLTDEEYLEFVKRNANKPFSDITPEETRNKIIQAFSLINSNTRKGNRNYNEMYITNPDVMGVFAYSADDNVGEIMQFISNQPEFLKQYALKNNLPFVVFGD